MNFLCSVFFGLILIVVSLCGLAAVPINRVVAIVNDQIITQSQLDQAVLADKQAIESSGGQAVPEGQLKKDVLDKLILQNLQLQLAKRAKIIISDTELNSAIAKIAEKNHLTTTQLYEILAREGMTEKQFRSKIHDQIIVSRVESAAVSKNVHVTDQEVKDFLKEAPKQMDEAGEYHLADIVISLNESATAEQITAGKNKAADLLKQLRNGADFSKLAMINSNGAESGQGGDLGWRKLNELPDLFVPSVKSLKKGDYTAPIQAPNGFHILKLIEVKNDNKLPTEVEAKQLVYQHKFEEQLQIWLQQVRHSAYVKVML